MRYTVAKVLTSYGSYWMVDDSESTDIHGRKTVATFTDFYDGVGETRAKKLADELNKSRICTVPPEGWYCNREGGHPGPCAAWPIEDD